jgi:hypothetical protein
MTTREVASLAPDYDAIVKASYSNTLLQFIAVTDAAVQSNMELNYTAEQFAVANSVQGCFRQDGLSGNALVCGVSAKEAAVQAFLNRIIANLQSVGPATTLDTPSIAAMLETYQSKDIAWLNANTFTPTYTMTGAQVAEPAPGYDMSVNASYANALLQVKAL